MLPKGLKSSLPNSALYYVDASVEIFKHKPFINKSARTKFEKFDVTLRKLDIYPQDYAHRLLRHLESWVLKKQWKTLPINMYMGQWALNLYLTEIGNRVYEHQTLDVEQQQILVQEEFTILQYMQIVGTYDAAVDELYPILSQRYRNATTQERTLVKQAAKNLYIERYGNV